jgi:hypothetical protein
MSPETLEIPEKAIQTELQEQPQSAIEYRRPTAADHMAARKAYILGKGSVYSIAREMNLSPASVKSWAFDEHWSDLRQEYEEREMRRLMGPKEPELPVIPQAKDSKGVQSAMIRDELDRIMLDMKACSDPKERSALAQAHSSLFKSWCILTGTKSPGTTKPSRRSMPQDTGDPITPASPTPGA